MAISCRAVRPRRPPAMGRILFMTAISDLSGVSAQLLIPGSMSEASQLSIMWQVVPACLPVSVHGRILLRAVGTAEIVVTGHIGSPSTVRLLV